MIDESQATSPFLRLKGTAAQLPIDVERPDGSIAEPQTAAGPGVEQHDAVNKELPPETAVTYLKAVSQPRVNGESGSLFINEIAASVRSTDMKEVWRVVNILVNQGHVQQQFVPGSNTPCFDITNEGRAFLTQNQ
ncbi:hypothetical protein KA078_02290 [Candidatus Woesebacteria bacterium]|nr:hypothetical protein [Candidatus Woesebacteria bacterium]